MGVGGQGVKDGSWGEGPPEQVSTREAGRVPGGKVAPQTPQDRLCLRSEAQSGGHALCSGPCINASLCTGRCVSVQQETPLRVRVVVQAVMGTLWLSDWDLSRDLLLFL